MIRGQAGPFPLLLRRGGSPRRREPFSHSVGGGVHLSVLCARNGADEPVRIPGEPGAGGEKHSRRDSTPRPHAADRPSCRRRLARDRVFRAQEPVAFGKGAFPQRRRASRAEPAEDPQPRANPKGAGLRPPSAPRPNRGPQPAPVARSRRLRRSQCRLRQSPDLRRHAREKRHRGPLMRRRRGCSRGAEPHGSGHRPDVLREVRLPAGPPRPAEVRQDHLPVTREEDVARMDVPVDQPLAREPCHRSGQPPRHMQNAVGAEPPPCAERLQRAALGSSSEQPRRVAARHDLHDSRPSGGPRHRRFLAARRGLVGQQSAVVLRAHQPHNAASAAAEGPEDHERRRQSRSGVSCHVHQL